MKDKKHIGYRRLVHFRSLCFPRKGLAEREGTEGPRKGFLKTFPGSRGRMSLQGKNLPEDALSPVDESSASPNSSTSKAGVEVQISSQSKNMHLQRRETSFLAKDRWLPSFC